MTVYRSELAGLKVVQYARVSTDDKDQRLDTQKIAMDKWCENRGVEVIAYYHEEMTGTTLNRPELKKAISEFMFGGADILLAYDQSRLTRGNDLAEIEKRIAPGRIFTVVMGDLSSDSLAGKITNAIAGIFDEEENRVRRSKTKMGIQTRKMVDHKHCGRPAKFMFAEDLEDAYKGRSREAHTTEDGKFHPSTTIITESQFYSYARDGYSLSWVAKNILHCSKSVLYAEIKPQEAEPSYRLRDYAKHYDNPKFPDDYIAYYRFKGKKDRYTPYMTLYEQAIAVRKGESSENVGSEDEKCSEREAEA
jgi:DNA invertase Pin-like site-specific DNA recombinase